MDAKFGFWSAAVVNFVVLTAFAVAGARQIKRGEVARHRRSMLIAGAQVVGFIVAYGFKLAFLGRENLAAWPARDLWVLRFHELSVLTMVVAGIAALVIGSRLARTRRVTFSPDDPPATSSQLSRHRRMGRVAIFGALFGLISAGGVWLGMLTRVGG